MINTKHITFIIAAMFYIKISFLFCFLFIFSRVKSQNLVPNPNFENTINLPCSWIVDPPSNFNSSIQNWTMPTNGSSDIYSTLVPQTCFAHCLSLDSWYSLGQQAPRSGTTMCGFFAYGPGGDPIYREYLEVKLNAPLIVGQRYYGEMYVSAAESMAYGCDNIGMYFSTGEVVVQGSMTVLPFTPQVKSTTIIVDTDQWVKISGTFVATTAAEYLIIGNFNDNISTNTILKQNSSTRLNAYYYIDDILVEQRCAPQDSTITICAGNTTTLSIDNSIVSWALASTPTVLLASTNTINVSPLVTTTYIATSSCGLTAEFEVVVDTNSEIITAQINNPGQICDGSAAFDFIATASTTGQNTLNYQWYLIIPSSTEPVGTNSPIYSYIPNAGDNNKTVKVVVTSSESCNPAVTASNEVLLNIRDVTTPTVLITTPNNPQCESIQTATFTATSTGAGTAPVYQWYVLPKATGVKQSVGTNAPIYNSTDLKNKDEIYVTLTSNVACQNGTNPYISNTISMLIAPIPAPVINEGNQTICSPKSFTYHGSVGTDTHLQWYRNNIGIPDATGPDYTATENGTYTLLEDNEICDFTSDPATLTIIPTLQAQAGDDIFASQGDMVTLNGSGGGSYSWSSASTLSNAFIVNPSLTATRTLTYILTVSEPGNDCSSEDYVTVFVQGPIKVPNVITVNGDGINDDWDIDNIEGYPDAIVDIYNRWGSLIWHTEGYSKNWDGTNYRNGQLLPDGTYFYIINLQDPKYTDHVTGWIQIIK